MRSLGRTGDGDHGRIVRPRPPLQRRELAGGLHDDGHSVDESRQTAHSRLPGEHPDDGPSGYSPTAVPTTPRVVSSCGLCFSWAAMAFASPGGPSGGAGRGDHRPAFLHDPAAEQLAAKEVETCVTMRHEGPPASVAASTPATESEDPRLCQQPMWAVQLGRAARCAHATHRCVRLPFWRAAWDARSWTERLGGVPRERVSSVMDRALECPSFPPCLVGKTSAECRQSGRFGCKRAKLAKARGAPRWNRTGDTRSRKHVAAVTGPDEASRRQCGGIECVEGHWAQSKPEAQALIDSPRPLSESARMPAVASTYGLRSCAHIHRSGLRTSTAVMPSAYAVRTASRRWAAMTSSR